MLPGGNGRDNVIIVVSCISDLQRSSGCGLSGGADVAYGPAASPLPKYDDGGLLAAPLLVTARLTKVVERRRLADISSPHIRGLWRQGSRSGGVLGGTGEIPTASPLPPKKEFVDNRSTMGSDIPPSSDSDDDGSEYCVGGAPSRGGRPR